MGALVPFILLLLALALALRVELFFVIVWFLAGIYVLSRLWTRRAAEGLRVQRAFLDRAFTGDHVTVDLALHNSGRLPVPWIEIEESIPIELRSELFPAQAFSLRGGETRRFSYALHCRRRGVYQLGPLRAESGDVLGIEQRALAANEARRLLVYPRIVPLERLGLPTRSALTNLPARLPLFEDPTRIMGVRDYRRGDSPRRINWKATARTNRLMVKQFQPATARDTQICLDLDIRDYELRSRYDAVEMAITVAASLAHHIVVNESLPAGLATVVGNDGDASRRRISLPPGAERGHLMALLEVLARVQMSPGESFPGLLRQEAVHLAWGTTMIVVTGSVSDELAGTLLYLQRSGHAVAVVMVRPSWLRTDEDAGIAGMPVWRVWADQDLAALA
ncbi:MAG TPA: DUF58 domain-containing protein [Chloroflexota bacterium]|nr:DUF58 domain-containing protein [Chloroflexota bacterium]